MKFLTTKQVCELTTLSRTEIIDRRVPEGRFPKPIRLSKHPRGRLVFVEADVIKWMQQFIPAE